MGITGLGVRLKVSGLGSERRSRVPSSAKSTSHAVDLTNELFISHPPALPYPIVLTMRRWSHSFASKKFEQ